MKALFKYVLVLALGIGVGSYSQWPVSFEDLRKFNWRDETDLVVNKVFALEMPQAAVASFDPAAAAQLDEDLDYRIAQRLASPEGWRAFLDAHPNGAHAVSAKAEVARLTLAARAPGAIPGNAARDASASGDPVASAPDSQETRVESLSAAPPAPAAPQAEAADKAVSSAPPAPGTQIATQTPAESLAPSSSAPPDASESPSEDSVPLPAARPRATASPGKMRALAAAPLPPRRPAFGCAAQSECSRKALPLPPILMALFSNRPKHPSGSGGRLPTDLQGR